MRPIKAVYSYYLPEVRAVIDELVSHYPHDVFLKSVDPGLDDYHRPVIEKFVDYQKRAVPALAEFAHRYPTSGSEEFIREYITRLRVPEIIVFEGEYEGYREIAKARGMATIEVPEGADPATIKPGHWFISNPSARDGNIISDDVVHRICEAGHTVFYDLAYLGATAFHRFDLSHPGIAAVAVSFSKTYGLFYYRVGFGFSRERIEVLEANKWFKSVFALLVADRVMDRIGPLAIAAKYKLLQKTLVAEFNAEHGLGVSPSDAFLIASVAADAVSAEGERGWMAEFRRGPKYRFCLTPYFERAERRGAHL